MSRSGFGSACRPSCLFSTHQPSSRRTMVSHPCEKTAIVEAVGWLIRRERFNKRAKLSAAAQVHCAVEFFRTITDPARARGDDRVHGSWCGSADTAGHGGQPGHGGRSSTDAARRLHGSVWETGGRPGHEPPGVHRELLRDHGETGRDGHALDRSGLLRAPAERHPKGGPAPLRSILCHPRERWWPGPNSDPGPSIACGRLAFA